MIHIITDAKMPFLVELFFTAIIVFIATLVLYVIACTIVRVLMEGYAWVTDSTASGTNLLDSLFNNTLDIFFCKSTDGDARLFFMMQWFAFGIVFYEIAIVLLITFALMYLARSVVRLKTALTSHIKDKKAHK